MHDKVSFATSLNDSWLQTAEDVPLACFGLGGGGVFRDSNSS